MNCGSIDSEKYDLSLIKCLFKYLEYDWNNCEFHNNDVKRALDKISNIIINDTVK